MEHLLVLRVHFSQDTLDDGHFRVVFHRCRNARVYGGALVVVEGIHQGPAFGCPDLVDQAAAGNR
jgi:hypothetical protein